LDIVNTIISFLTPLAIAVVGFFIQRVLAQQNQNWRIQERLVDKRVEIYQSIAEDLNKIYCYVMDVGTFKDESPDEIIQAKRNVDKNMYMYQAIWPEETFNQFKEYMDSAFATYQGYGEDAKIRATTIEKRSAYKKGDKNWQDDWDKRFTGKRDPEHQPKYKKLMNLISRDLMYLPVNTGNQK
jgi:hypothetical protein